MEGSGICTDEVTHGVMVEYLSKINSIIDSFKNIFMAKCIISNELPVFFIIMLLKLGYAKSF